MEGAGIETLAAAGVAAVEESRRGRERGPGVRELNDSEGRPHMRLEEEGVEGRLQGNEVEAAVKAREGQETLEVEGGEIQGRNRGTGEWRRSGRELYRRGIC